MLSLVELERVAARIAAAWAGARVQRWIEPERGVLAFSLRPRRAPGAESGPGKQCLQIDARPGRAHLGAKPRLPAAPKNMPAFTAYLRAHLGSARLESALMRGADRQLELIWSMPEARYKMLLSVFGRRSNLYLLSESDVVLQALRPLSETRPELALGETYQDPGGDAPSSGKDRFSEVADSALLAAIDAHYDEASEAARQSDLQRDLRRALKRELKSTARRLEKLESDLAEADQADRLARDGELLKANLGRIEPGASSVRVEGWDGEPVEIPLDPKLSAKGNLEATFKRYQKLLRRLTKSGGQVEQAKAALAELEGLEAELARAESEDDQAALERLSEHPKLRSMRSKQAAKSKGPLDRAEKSTQTVPAAYRNLPRKLHPRRYASADGLEIWVGRSDEGNDVLTTRLARGNDLFFHLDGAPGSHVILRTEGQTEPPPESVLDACELAVQFSKQKNASSADVHISPIKNVKKPKGAKRGLVYVSGGRSIRLRREEARLARLLAARMDD